MMLDYYALLGVPREASDEDIKAAFRRFALIWHPDVNKRPDAAERFGEFDKAKDVLLDPEARAEYDRRLDAGIPDAAAPTADDEWAPTVIRVEPESVDFGVLEVGGPPAEVEIVLSWDGATGTIRPTSMSGEWWEVFHYEKAPGVNALVFSLRAEAHEGMTSGRHTAQFDIQVDDDIYSVELIMTVTGRREAGSPPGDDDEWTPAGGATGRRRAAGPSIPSIRFPVRRGWIFGAVALTLVVVYLVSSGSKHSSPPAAPYAQATNEQPTSTPSTSSTSSISPSPSASTLGPVLPANLPETAATVFNAKPAFQSTGTKTGRGEVAGGNDYNVQATAEAGKAPFTVMAHVDIRYDPRVDNVSGTPGRLAPVVATSCMDVVAVDDTSPTGEEAYPEPALSSNLHDSGTEVTGTLVFAAVLPGTYEFNMNCAGDVPDYWEAVGRVSYAGGGIADGDRTNSEQWFTIDYNAMALLGERAAKRNTVFLFGASGLTQWSLPLKKACLRKGTSVIRSASVIVDAYHTGNDQVDTAAQTRNAQMYELGSMTFDVPTDQLAGYELQYNCFTHQDPSGNPLANIPMNGLVFS